MCSTLPGDSRERSCARYCRSNGAPATSARHCGHCLCASCPFCSVNLTEAKWAAARDSLPDVDAAGVAQVQRGFLAKHGVLMRMWECSLAGCVGRADDAHNPFFDRCVRTETARSKLPASMLRWDVPAALFIGGRCTEPTAAESGLYPDSGVSAGNSLHVELPDAYGWRRRGFSGHNVTQSAVGWILHPHAPRDIAFGHDAWEIDPRRAIYQRPPPSCAKVSRSTWAKEKPAMHYALARFEATKRAPLLREPPQPQQRGAAGDGGGGRAGSAPHRLQLAAAAYRDGWINTSAHCYHWDWEAALADQRAFARLVAKRANESRRSEQHVEPECSVWGSLYNQMHVSYNASLLRAIFYVNDSETPRRHPGPLRDSRGTHAQVRLRRGFRTRSHACAARMHVHPDHIHTRTRRTRVHVRGTWRRCASRLSKRPLGRWASRGAPSGSCRPSMGCSCRSCSTSTPTSATSPTA